MPVGARVLVVEDDHLVRGMAVDALREEGFHVFEAQDGDAAAKHLSEQDVFHALFTDVQMPGGMDGIEVALHARTIHPGLPVIVVSGYAANIRHRLEALDPPVEFFTKPYRPGQIADTLRRFTA